MKINATKIFTHANVSVIVPVRNEKQNLEDVILRINDTLLRAKQKYEIIAIDDYSTDGSYEFLKKLSIAYPLRVYKKKRNHW